MSKDLDDTTKCLECGYGMPPIEVVRTDSDLVDPKCGRAFGRSKRENDTYCSDLHFRIASNNQR